MKKIKYIILSLFILTFFISCKKDSNQTTTPNDTTLVPTTKVDVNKPSKLESLSDLDDVILYSMNNTYLVKTNSSIKDGNIEVYKLDRSITIEDSASMSGSVVTNYYKLGSSFKLDDKDIKVESFNNLDVKQLFGLNINESYFSSNSISSSNVSLVIKKDKVSDCFNDENIKSDSDINVNIKISDFKITQLSFEYVLDNKNISSVTTYNYL